MTQFIRSKRVNNNSLELYSHLFSSPSHTHSALKGRVPQSLLPHPLSMGWLDVGAIQKLHDVQPTQSTARGNCYLHMDSEVSTRKDTFIDGETNLQGVFETYLLKYWKIVLQSEKM